MSDAQQNTPNFQVLEGENKQVRDEADLQIERDQDARSAEEALRMERDQIAKQKIDEAIQETTRSLTEKITNEAQQVINNAVSNVQENATKEFKDTLFTLLADLESKGVDMLSGLLDQLNATSKQRIAEIITMIEDQERNLLIERDRDTREAEAASRALRDASVREQALQFFRLAQEAESENSRKRDKELREEAIKIFNEVAVETADKRLEKTTQAVQEVQTDMIKTWTDKMIQNQITVTPKLFFDTLRSQQEVFLDTTNSLFKLYAKMFSFERRD